MLDEQKLYVLLKQFEARLNALEDSVNNTLKPTSVAGGREDVQVADNEHFKPTLSGFFQSIIPLPA